MCLVCIVEKLLVVEGEVVEVVVEVVEVVEEEVVKLVEVLAE